MLPPRRPRWLALTLTLAAAVAVAVVGCGSSPSASFDPSGPCTSDGSAAGAYLDLEALIPTPYHDAAPDTVDSGRNCTAENLGSLAGHGIDEVRFAGGTWTFGEAAVVLAVFRAPGLTADAMTEFYGTSADANGRTQVLDQQVLTIAGRQGRRLDTKTGERMQTVVVWPSAVPDVVNVVLTHDMPEARIQEAIDTFGAD